MLVSYDPANIGRPYNTGALHLRDALHGISNDTYNIIRDLHKDQPLKTTLHEILVGCPVWNLARSLPRSTYSIEMRNGHYPSGIWAFFGEDRPSMPLSQPWPAYGMYGSVLGPLKNGRRTIQTDVFNNERCRWWVEEGYERVETDAKVALRNPKRVERDLFGPRQARQVESGAVLVRDELKGSQDLGALVP